MKHLLVFICLCTLLSCTTTHTIVDRPIIFDEERKQLSLEYLLERYGLEQEEPVITPKMIVLHWTVIPTLEKSFEAFNPAKLPNWRPEIKGAGALNVSAQFLVDRDGTIYRLLPETTMARHVIGLNHCAIGIENVGGGEALPLTKAQLKANIWLVDYLSEIYDIEYVIGHYEYTQFEGHALWLEKDTGYRTQKTDPGPKFVKRVKRANKNHNYKTTPKTN
jgi:N-acetyl-anhydromuramyl-L-alanine amidase AmpD